MRRPSAAALALALIPFATMCFSVPLWDRDYPMPLGLPFNLFWLITWIVLSTLCMWAVYRIEPAGSAPRAESSSEESPDPGSSNKGHGRAP